MRPLQLKLKGINSYREEQIIDFETLTSQGLFGIFGPTGSGKSTILDAMTLALYAKLPRDTKNFINTNEKNATVSFLFSITTDHTIKYLAERSFRYHTIGTTSTVRNTTGRLIAYDKESETILADKPTDVTAECINLLGLTSDDFMRTVVLPQGQFSEFLRLKNKERRIMLQRIFHLEKYGIELTSKIAHARQKQDLLLSNLIGEKKYFEQISSEKLAELKQNEQKYSNQLTSLLKEVDILEKRFAKTDELFTLQQELAPLEEKEKKNQKLLPNIQEKEKRLDTAKRASQLQPFSIQVASAQITYDQDSLKLNVIQKEKDILQANFETAYNTYIQATTTQKEKLPILQKEEQLLKNALSIATVIKEWKESQKNFQNRLQTISSSLMPLKKQQEDCLKKEQQLRQEIENSEKILEEAKISSEKKALLEKGNIMEETYREKRQNYEKNAEPISSLKAELQTEQVHFSEKKKHLLSIHMQLSNRLSFLNKQYTDATKKLNSLKEKQTINLQQQKLWEQNHMAQLLREELHEGSLCPVCGVPYKQHTSDNQNNIKADASSLQLLKQTQKELENSEQKQRDLLAKLDRELSILNTQIPTLKMMLEISEPLLLEENNLNHNPLDYSSISEELSEYSQTKGHLNQKEIQYRNQSQLLKEQHDTLQKYAQTIFLLREKNGISNFSKELQALRQKEQDLQETQQFLKEKRQVLENTLSQKDSLTSQILTLENEKSSLVTNIKNCKKIIAQQLKQIPENFSVDTDFPLEITKIIEQQQTIIKHFQHSEEVYKKTQETLQKKREELGSCESSVHSSREQFTRAKNLYLKQKFDLGFSENEEPELYYIEDEESKQMQKEIDSYYIDAKKNQERINYLQEKIGNQHVDKTEWLHQKNELTSINEQIKELNSSILLLQHQITEMTNNLTKKLELEQRWQKEAHKKDIIKELEQLFKGNAFIEYVAQSKLSYIAREASVILSQISGGNYTLEINESSEFIIRDNKNGGAIRPSDTLSGGEIFITSLALALALSSSIQLNGAAPLEFFFLDEGFGSLDDDLLDTVMSSLERLQSKKRSIGIISHVEAIQARVPIKLLVTPSDFSQMGSQITLEYS